MIWLSVGAFAIAWWLGLYLLSRDSGKPVLRRASVGLLAFAAAVAVQPLEPSWAPDLTLVVMCVPAVAWSGVFVLLAVDVHEQVDKVWRRGVVPLFVVLSVAAAFGVRFALPVLVGLAVFALVGGLGLLLWTRTAAGLRGSARGLVLLATPMLALGTALPLLGTDVLPRDVLLVALALDLVLLGVAVAVFDAFDEGQVLGPDMARSLLVAGAAAIVFGGQVGVAIAVTGERPALVVLLYGTVAAAVGVQVLLSPIQAAADRIALRSSRLRRTRDELREVADSLPRKAAVSLAELPEEEFARLTRRAIGHYGDLGKLVASPLVDLPVIDDRLAARGASTAPLERATELKAVLQESIERLKPAGPAEFGSSEEWRHYNALYFYYVRGIRPYSVRTKRTDLDPASRQALRWFAEQVPERTLHNWQNAAARLVAADLRAGLRAPA